MHTSTTFGCRLLLLTALSFTSTPRAAAQQSAEPTIIRAERITAKLRTAGHDIKGSWSDGFIAIEKDGKRTYIDSNGKALLPPQFEEASDFRRGYAQVTRGGAWGVIDRAGMDLFPFRADWTYIGEEHDGTMVFGSAAGKQGMINTKGEIMIPADYDDIAIFDWSHNAVPVKQGEKTGLINREGRLIAPLVYDYMAYFSEGTSRAPVRRDGRWGIINTAGVLVHPVSMRYEYMASFYNGLAAVSNGSKAGYIDTTGAAAIPLIYDKAGPFNRWGHATVFNKGIASMIDTKGKTFLKGAYIGIEQVGADMYRVSSARAPYLSGMVNAAGKILWPLKYSNIVPMGDGIFSVSLNDAAILYYANEKGVKIAEHP